MVSPEQYRSPQPPSPDQKFSPALDPENPVDRVFAELIEIMHKRAQKYTAGNWDDNFVYTAKKMREAGWKNWTAADSAMFLEFVKDARQDAAAKSGRRDFDDDSYRDSDFDKINYRILRMALKDTEVGRSYE